MEINSTPTILKMSDKSLKIALNARLSALRMTNTAKSAHIGSSLSVIDILAVLFGDILCLLPDKLKSDCIIVSKGHAAAGTYAVIAHAGLIPIELLETFGVNGSILGGHVTHNGNPTIELSTGSLGHGLPYGIGVAYSQLKLGLNNKTFVVMSDGECDEGTTWESALMANHFKLKNLIVIIDRNRIQSLSGTENVLSLEPLAEKWRAFNWKVLTINGHSHLQLANSFSNIDGPLCIIADTIKGKGVSFMENQVLWHYRPPSNEELALAINEIEDGLE